MTRRPGRDARQQSMLPTWAQHETERRALVRGALRNLGVRLSGMLYELESIVIYIDRYSDEQGCAAHARTLARHCGRDGHPISERTLERRLKLLRDHRMVSLWWDAGRARRRVDWRRIRSLALSPAVTFEKSKVAEGAAKVAEGAAKVAERHYKELLEDSIKELIPSPLTPQSPSVRVAPAATLDVGGVEGEEESFAALEPLLRTCGVAAVETAIATAQSRGLSPCFVRAAIAHFHAQAPAWHGGALLVCLRRASPGDAATDARLWPPPSPEYARHARLARLAESAREQQAAAAVQRRQMAEAQRAEATLEARFGPSLDRLSTAQLDELARSILPSPAERRFYEADLRRNPVPKGTLRSLLLRAIEAQTPKLKTQIR